MKYYVTDKLPVFIGGIYTYKEFQREEAMEWLQEKEPWTADLQDDRVRHEIRTHLFKKEIPTLPAADGPIHLGPDTEVLLVRLAPVHLVLSLPEGWKER